MTVPTLIKGFDNTGKIIYTTEQDVESNVSLDTIKEYILKLQPKVVRITIDMTVLTI